MHEMRTFATCIKPLYLFCVSSLEIYFGFRTPILGKILLDKDWVFFCPHINAKTSTLRILFKLWWSQCKLQVPDRAWVFFKYSVISSSGTKLTSNTLWACVFFLLANHGTKIFCFCVHSGTPDLIYPGTSLYEHILWMHLEKNWTYACTLPVQRMEINVV